MSTAPSAHPAERPVVTIFEMYGAGAEYVGRRVAEALGLPFHAQAFSSEEIEGTESTAADQRAVLAQVYAVMGGAYGGFGGFEVAATQREKYDIVMNLNKQVWADADEGGVIVGRNGAVILASRPNTVHVLLTGTVEDRVARAAADAGISREQAAQRQQHEDQVRADMSETFYGWDPRLPDRYDVVFNTSRVPLDSVVDAILGTLHVVRA